jgi:hypothetical protein
MFLAAPVGRDRGADLPAFGEVPGEFGLNLLEARSDPTAQLHWALGNGGVHGTPAQGRGCIAGGELRLAEGFLIGAQREFCRAWPNQQTVTVPGSHFLPEDAPEVVGEATARFVAKVLAGQIGVVTADALATAL